MKKNYLDMKLQLEQQSQEMQEIYKILYQDGHIKARQVIAAEPRRKKVSLL